MRRGFNALRGAEAGAGLECTQGGPVYFGHLFVFRGRRGDMLKIIWWHAGSHSTKSERDRKVFQMFLVPVS